eukprot:scaffold91793_cov38-Prasinocladus_malaysianus.AAC.1
MLTTSSLAMKETAHSAEDYTSVMKAEITPKAETSYFRLSAPAVGAAPTFRQDNEAEGTSPARDYPPMTFSGYVPTNPCKIVPQGVEYDVQVRNCHV